ncbi:MAG: hypothetical protein GY859_13810 [Desulfobacterales bacterium]|nr:hypothetical protein [Desulfobacterales bacterium]
MAPGLIAQTGGGGGGSHGPLALQLGVDVPYAHTISSDVCRPCDSLWRHQLLRPDTLCRIQIATPVIAAGFGVNPIVFRGVGRCGRGIVGAKGSGAPLSWVKFQTPVMAPITAMKLRFRISYHRPRKVVFKYCQPSL